MYNVRALLSFYLAAGDFTGPMCLRLSDTNIVKHHRIEALGQVVIIAIERLVASNLSTVCYHSALQRFQKLI